jgi:hypothetical protein
LLAILAHRQKGWLALTSLALSAHQPWLLLLVPFWLIMLPVARGTGEGLQNRIKSRLSKPPPAPPQRNALPLVVSRPRRQITGAFGVSRATLYRQFPNARVLERKGLAKV